MEQRQRKTGMSEFFVDSWGHPAERVSYFLSDWDERLWCNPWQDGVIPRCDVIFGYRGVFRELGDCRGARVFWDAEEILRGPRCFPGPRCFRGKCTLQRALPTHSAGGPGCSAIFPPRGPSRPLQRHSRESGNPENCPDVMDPRIREDDRGKWRMSPLQRTIPTHSAGGPGFPYFPDFWILPQVSRRVTVRLKTSFPRLLSGSTQK